MSVSADKAERSVGAGERPRGGAERVLLYVEDNPANIALMRDLIDTMDDVELLVSSTAEAGIAVAREREPDVILMDINLPGMNGYAALKALQAATETRDIPVIALTATSSERDRERGIRAGFCDYMTKPFQVDALISALETLFARR